MVKDISIQPLQQKHDKLSRVPMRTSNLSIFNLTYEKESETVPQISLCNNASGEEQVETVLQTANQETQTCVYYKWNEMIYQNKDGVCSTG